MPRTALLPATVTLVLLTAACADRAPLAAPEVVKDAAPAALIGRAVDGGILYERNLGYAGVDNYEIFRMKSTGDSVVRLTTNTFNDRSPAWTKDLARIAFVSNRDGNDEIYVMNADGSNVMRVTYTPTLKEDNPVFSPDGVSLAWVEKGATEDTRRVAYRAVTGRGLPTNYMPRIACPSGSYCAGTVGAAFSPTWSPDGTEIAYFAVNPMASGQLQSTTELRRVTVSGHVVHTLVTGLPMAFSAHFSPDGKRIATMVYAFNGWSGTPFFQLVDAKTGALGGGYAFPKQGTTGISRISWSPSGAHVLVSWLGMVPSGSGFNVPGSELVKVNLNGPTTYTTVASGVTGVDGLVSGGAWSR
jgi:hypothetical protein